MIDETGIEPALREGPPFRTRYVQRPLPLGSETGTGASRLLAAAIVAVLLVVAFGGGALVGSGIVDFHVPPVLPGSSVAPTPRGDGSWTATGSMSTAFDGPAVLLPDGTVLVVGGSDEVGMGLLSAQRYDPRSGSWTATTDLPAGGNGQSATDLPAGRNGHSATLLPDGTVLVAGGRGDANNGGTEHSSAVLYDPRTGSWTATGTMLRHRAGHTATLLPNGRVLVAGGSGFDGTIAAGELYDPRTGSWTDTGDMVDPREGHTATLLPDGTVLVAGGASDARTELASAELYDPRTGLWTATGPMRVAGGGRTATLLPDGTVLVVGSGGSRMFAFAELYDPSTGSWTTTGDMIEPRGYHTATLLPDGRVLVAGGANGVGDHHLTNTVELYDPGTRSWTATASLALDRKFHNALLLLDGRVLVAGGTDHPTDRGWHRLATAELYGPVSGD